MFKKNFAFIMAAFMALTIASPTMAFARRGADDNGFDDHGGNHSENHFSDDKNYGLDFSKKHRGGESDHSLAPRGIVMGEVMTKTATGFTIKGRKDVVYTVDASTATITKIPNTAIVLVDIVVGDHVSVQGTKTNTNISATKVFVIPQNLRKAEAKGVVTAISGNDITMTTKRGKSVTVKVDGSTQILKEHHQATTLSDIVVGSKLKVHGTWDSILNILNAVKIKIK